MNRFMVFFVLCLVTLGLISSQTILIQAESDSQASNNAPLLETIIHLTNFGFDPKTVSVQVGTTVKWSNDTSVTHTIQIEDGMVTVPTSTPIPTPVITPTSTPIPTSTATSVPLTPSVTVPSVTATPQPSSFQIYLPILPNCVDLADGECISLSVVRSTIVKPTQQNGTLLTINPGQSVSYHYDTVGNFSYFLTDQTEFQGLVIVTDPPQSIQLAELENKTVDVGSTLHFIVTAIGPTSDTVHFEVAPLPLAENMDFNSSTGEFSFKPSSAQTGQSYDLTFSAVQGSTTDEQKITITVPQPLSSADTVLQGRILDANEAELGRHIPISGATITLLGNGQTTTTDSGGYFNFTGLSGGKHAFEYNGITAEPAGKYGAYRSEVVIEPNVVNVIERPIFIMKLDNDGMTDVDPNNTTNVDNPNIDVSIEIPANTVMKGDQIYDGVISVSEVPDEFTPGSLPSFLDPSFVVTIQPMGLTFNNPAPISFPNTDRLEPGSLVNIWSMDHETSQFFIAGTGKVSADGTTIETIEGGIRESSWHFPLPLAPVDQQPKDKNENDEKEDECNTSSTVSMQSGCLKTDFYLPSYDALGGNYQLGFTYSSNRAYPIELIPFESVLSANSAVPDKISYQSTFGGMTGFETYLSSVRLGDGTVGGLQSTTAVRGVVAVEGENLPTGGYAYVVQTSSHFGEAKVKGRTPNGATALIVNERNSAFGSGWGLNGLQKLYPQQDGSVLLVDGNGDRLLYSDPLVGVQLTIGEQVAGSIETIGEQDNFSFRAEAGESIYIDVQGGTLGASDMSAQLIDSDGSVVFALARFEDSWGHLLTKGGTYTLILKSTALGTYQFQIKASTAIASGQTANGEITPVGEFDIYHFAGIAGDIWLFGAAENGTTIGEPLSQIYRPDNTLLCENSGFSGASKICFLDSTGQYTLLVRENGNNQLINYTLFAENLTEASNVKNITISQIITDEI